MSRSRGFNTRTANFLVLLLIFILSFSFHYYDYLSTSPIKSHPKFYKRNESLRDVNTELINLKDFRFKTNPRKLCSYCTDEDNFLLLITIPSSLAKRDERDHIRLIWGKATKCTKLLFLTGSSDDSTSNVQVFSESRKYGDILQGSFSDNWDNLTYKHVMALKWVSHYCKRAKFVIKLDDDFLLFLLQNYVELDLTKLRLFLKRVMVDYEGIACRVLRNGTVYKKWTSTEPITFTDEQMPYCWGGLVIYTASVVRRLLEESHKVPYSVPDDVHVTGILARRIGVKHLNFEPHVFLKIREKRLVTQLGEQINIKLKVKDVNKTV